MDRTVHKDWSVEDAALFRVLMNAMQRTVVEVLASQQRLVDDGTVAVLRHLCLTMLLQVQTEAGVLNNDLPKRLAEYRGALLGALDAFPENERHLLLKFAHIEGRA